MLRLAAQSLYSRRFTAALTVLSIGLAVALLLGVERVREQARDGFASTVSGVDVIAGARTSGQNLLLTSVFHAGTPTNNLSWASYRWLASRPSVAWSVPLALGDSHRGYRVAGTGTELFTHFRYGRDRSLQFAVGRRFDAADEVVLGAEVARRLNYRLEHKLVLSHGSGELGLVQHAANAFRITGILAPTATPLDRAVLVPLDGLDVIHAETASDDPLQQALGGAGVAAPAARSVSAVLLGLRQRTAALTLQREINEYPSEPLTAILPGVSLLELWQTLSTLEQSMRLISALVVAVGLTGMMTALLTSFDGRRRELAILRSVGAGPRHIVSLICAEAAFLAALGILLGNVLLYAGLAAAREWLARRLGLELGFGAPQQDEWWQMAAVLLAAIVVALVPAIRAYRQSLADGLTFRS
jgi:putative ABC transport system permease protein